MCMKHLNDQSIYRDADFDPKKARQLVINSLERHGRYWESKKFGTITQLARSFTQIDIDKLRPSPFRCHPKAHKEAALTEDGELDIPSRPLAPQPGTATEHASRYLSKKLIRGLKPSLPTACWSTHDFVLEIEDINDEIRRGIREPFSMLHRIMVADVSALYPSIPTRGDHGGIAAMEWMCNRTKAFSKEDIAFFIDLLCTIMLSNFVAFEDVVKLQIDGTSMGTPVSVIYAIVFMYFLEHDIVDDLELYKRFIDDIFAIAEREECERFLADFKRKGGERTKLDPSSIKIERSGVFLDMVVSILDNGLLSLTMYQKPNNAFAYLPEFSLHPRPTILGWVRGEFRRIRLLNHRDEDFEHFCELFEERLQARGYSPDTIAEAKANLPSRTEILADLRRKREEKKASAMTEDTDEADIAEASQRKKRGPITHLRLPQFKKRPNLQSAYKVDDDLKKSDRWQHVFGDNDPIVGTVNRPNIGKIVANHIIKAKTTPKK